MRNFSIFLIIFSLHAGFLAAQELSGILDTTFNYTAGERDASSHYWGVEEYANIRLRVRASEKASFFGAFNLIAASGTYALPVLDAPAAVSGENYVAAMELERLYFRVNGDYLDGEAGLLRMNFGYGQVWGSSDFLNPHNPLFPNARPRGVLGMNASFYPIDSLKIMGFAAAPKNPLELKGGFIPGFSLDKHWDRASLQVLYAFETPLDATPAGVHRFGLSFKADVELGFVADALYTLNPDETEGIKGLSSGAGFDYNFLGGDLYVLAEYLYNGSSSASALGFGGDWINRHYLFGTALYRFNDYCNLSLSTVYCFDDISFSPFLTLNYEVFQGFIISLVTRFCFDRKDFSGGEAGELGPYYTGARAIVSAAARLRF